MHKFDLDRFWVYKEYGYDNFGVYSEFDLDRYWVY